MQAFLKNFKDFELFLGIAHNSGYMPTFAEYARGWWEWEACSGNNRKKGKNTGR
jgi:hypothetical protein